MAGKSNPGRRKLKIVPILNIIPTSNLNAVTTPNENTNLSKFIANFDFYGDVKIITSTASAFTRTNKAI
ncbi:hypothetical protein D3C87_2005980 [compost metagenome]